VSDAANHEAWERRVAAPGHLRRADGRREPCADRGARRPPARQGAPRASFERVRLRLDGAVGAAVPLYRDALSRGLASAARRAVIRSGSLRNIGRAGRASRLAGGLPQARRAHDAVRGFRPGAHRRRSGSRSRHTRSRRSPRTCRDTALARRLRTRPRRRGGSRPLRSARRRRRQRRPGQATGPDPLACERRGEERRDEDARLADGACRAQTPARARRSTSA
jgi:hypothetical protein